MTNYFLASTRYCCILFAAAAAWAVPDPAAAQAFPDQIAEYLPTHPTPFGIDHFPGNVLGPPHGSLNPETPQELPQHLLSLGNSGSITLEFTTNWVVDGPGPDFIVFENPFQPTGQPNWTFSETAYVEVSEDGTTWTLFPFDFIPPGPGDNIMDKANFAYGFAGINPVFSAPGNGVSPFDPNVAGGDAFDLADIGIARCRFIRITDTGLSATLDINGDIVADVGNQLAFAFGPAAGFDLDAVAAIHTEPRQACAGREWELYE